MVFSGAGQFAALPLWHQGGGVVVLSALALSLRFTLITASMAPMLVDLPRWMRAAVAYCVTDENYALAVTRRRGVLEPGFLVGSWIPLYGAWLIGTLAGVLLGAQVPAEGVGPLKAVFPLVFLVLTVLLCTSIPLAVVAVLGALLSVVGSMFLTERLEHRGRRPAGQPGRAAAGASPQATCRAMTARRATVCWSRPGDSRRDGATGR